MEKKMIIHQIGFEEYLEKNVTLKVFFIEAFSCQGKNKLETKKA